MSNKLVGAAIAIFVIILLTVIVLFSLGRNSSKDSTKTTTTSKDKITLTVWRTFDDETTFTQAIQNYQQDHPNVTINYVKKDLADYEVQSVNALAAGTGPDIWSIQNESLTRHLGKLVPLPEDFFKTKRETRSNEELYKATWSTVATKDNIVDHKVYGIPLYVDTLALYVNSNIWEAARSDYRKNNFNNPNFDDALFRRKPATWNELLDELPYLTKKDDKGNITQGGIALGTSANVTSSADILSLLMLQNSTKMVDEAQKSARFNTFANDSSGKPIYPGTNALDFYTSFARSDKANYSWSKDMPNDLRAFIDGKVAIMVGYQYVGQVLKQQAPTLQYEVAPMPQVKGGTTTNYASYWTETVTNNSRNAQAAWEFLTWLGSHPHSYLRSAKRSSAMLPDPQNPITFDVYTDQVASAQTWPKGNAPDKVNQVFRDMIDNVTLKGQPLQQTIDTAATAVTDLLQKE